MMKRSSPYVSVRTSRNLAGMLVRPLASTVFWKMPRNMPPPAQLTTRYHFLPLCGKNYTRGYPGC